MKMSEAFPSKYLKAEDLKGQRIPVTISHVSMEDVGDDNAAQKPVLYFQGSQKGMVLNKTNANQLVYLYGDDTDGWPGKQVELFTMMVEYQGRSVPGLRIAPPPGQRIEQGTMPDGRPTLPNTPGQAIGEDPFGFDQ